MIPRLYGLFKASHDGHQLRLLIHESQLPLFPEDPSSECIILAGPRLSGHRRAWWEYRNISRIAADMRADVLFYPYQIGSRVNGIRTVLMIRNMEPFHFHDYKYSCNNWVRNRLLKFGSRRAIAGAERVIAVSGFVEDYLHLGIGIHPSRIRRIYHGRDDSFGPEGDASRDAALITGLGIHGDFILTCGSLLPYRRCEDVIAAFGRIEPTVRRELLLVIAGSGTDRNYAGILERAIATSSAAERIRLVGHVSTEAMQALYRCCRLCVIASEVEACPNIAIEAMASGCVTAASDSPPLPEMFAGATAHFPSRDLSALATTMQRCLTDEKLRQDLSERAQFRARDFSWDLSARETCSALVDW
jgi:glycosyltransferase involved in cell wall biosynthesis